MKTFRIVTVHAKSCVLKYDPHTRARTHKSRIENYHILILYAGTTPSKRLETCKGLFRPMISTVIHTDYVKTSPHCWPLS